METIATTTTGRVRGRERRDVLLFAGIPYAAPPIGELRFRPPSPHAGWDDVRDATKFGPTAPQPAGALGGLLTGAAAEWNEDCLTLNITTPALDDARRPVLFWIHGGGFTGGTGATPWYDGRNFAVAGDVVHVSINYRLGALGFLELDQMDAGLTGTGNLGMADQVAALRWVRDNIAAFGGSPDDVTIFGESAGGMSVATLLATPSAAGLFHRAIAQSGAAHNARTIASAAEITGRFFDALGAASVDELMSRSAESILGAQDAVTATLRADAGGDLSLALPFGPVVDGAFLPIAPLDAVRAGSAAGIPLMCGTTRDEWKLFHVMSPSALDDPKLERRFGRIFADPGAALEAYRAARPGGDADDLWCAALTDLVFRLPALRLAEAQSANGGPVFVYRFDWATKAFGGRLGSCHALEIPFVYDNLGARGAELLLGDAPPAALATAMHRAWLAFATSGDPSHDGLGAWPAYELPRRPTMRFDVTCSVDDDPDGATRELWDDLV